MSSQPSRHCRASVALTSQALLPVVLEAGRPATGEAPSEGTSEAPSEATGGTDTRAPRLERIIVSVADGERRMYNPRYELR